LHWLLSGLQPFGSLLKLFDLLIAESIFHLAGIRQFASLRLGKVRAIELPSFAGDAQRLQT